MQPAESLSTEMSRDLGAEPTTNLAIEAPEDPLMYDQCVRIRPLMYFDHVGR